MYYRIGDFSPEKVPYTDIKGAVTEKKADGITMKAVYANNGKTIFTDCGSKFAEFINGIVSASGRTPPVTNEPEDLKQNLIDYIKKNAATFVEKKEKIYIAPDIPAKMLGNAIASYARDINDIKDIKNILALYDNTWFGGGKLGTLFTTDCIYDSELYLDPQRKISYEDIAEVGLEQSEYSTGNTVRTDYGNFIETESAMVFSIFTFKGDRFGITYKTRRSKYWDILLRKAEFLNGVIREFGRAPVRQGNWKTDPPLITKE
jgi:hypothetical protein